MQAVLFTDKGVESGKIKLDDRVFGKTVHMGLIHQLLKVQHANARTPIAHTKTRSERNGSTRKLYKQKGTGQARAGDSRSPTRRGGGVAFGPLNVRDYSIRMNKKERRLALFGLLSNKAKDSQVKVLESLSAKMIKTKDMLELAQTMNLKSAVLAVRPEDKAAFQAGRNIPNIKVIGANYLNPHDLLKYQDLILTKDSLEFILSHYAS